MSNYTSQQAGLEHVREWEPLLIGFPETLETPISGRAEDERHLFQLINGHNHVLITGPEGIGKSSLAIHCALKWTHRNYISYAAFLPMESEHTAEQSFKSVSKRIGFFIDQLSGDKIRKLFTYIKDELKSKRILFIYDNIEHLSVKKYLPNEKNIIVLGTTVHKTYKKLFNVYKLAKLSEENSIPLTLEMCQDAKAEVKDLRKRLNNSPLAIRQAIAFIKDEKSRNPYFSVSDYIKIHKLNFPKRLSADVNIYTDEALRVAVRLNRSKVATDRVAYKILNCMAFMNPSHIRSDMFFSGFKQQEYYAAERQLKKYTIITIEIQPQGRYLKIHRTYLRILYSEMPQSIRDELTPFVFKLVASSGELLLHHEYLLKHMTAQTVCEGYRQLFSSGQFARKLTKHLRKIGCAVEHIKDWAMLHYVCYNQDYMILNHICNMTEYESSWSILHAAVLSGRDISLDLTPEKITMIFRDQMYVNAQTSTGLTPLHISVALGADENIDFLLDMGCDVNVRDHKGDTPLHLAVQNSDADLTAKLLFAGGKANVRNNEGNTPLHLAAMKGNKYLIQLFMLSGGNLNAMNIEGYTPVYLSAHYKHSALTEFMIESQTGYNAGENQFLTNVNLPYKTHFKKNDKTFIYTFLTNQTWLTISRPYKSRVIKNCVGLRMLTKVEDALELLKHCLPGQSESLLSVVYLLEKMPLALQMAAAYILHDNITIPQFCKYIHEAPAPIKHKQFMSYCSNHVCSTTIKLMCLVITRIKKNYPEAYQILCFASYMNPSYICLQRLSDYTNLTPNQIQQQIKILVSYLILNKINQDTYSMDKVIGALVHLDLEPAGKETIYCKRILLVEVTKYFYPEVDFVLNFLDDGDICSVYKQAHAVLDEGILILKRLNKIGCRIEDTAKWSALHYAATDDCLVARQVIISLLLRGSKPNVSSSNGLTPLHVASACGNDWAVARFLLAGAEVNVVTNGQTALHLAARCAYDTEDTVRALVKKNANRNALDGKRHTPAQVAKQCNNIHLINVIGRP